MSDKGEILQISLQKDFPRYECLALFRVLGGDSSSAVLVNVSYCVNPSTGVIRFILRFLGAKVAHEKVRLEDTLVFAGDVRVKREDKDVLQEGELSFNKQEKYLKWLLRQEPMLEEVWFIKFL